MSIYTVFFILTVLIAIVCLIIWHKIYKGEGTVMYAVYIAIILSLLAAVFSISNAW